MDTPEADCRTFCPAALWQGRNKTGLDLLVESRQMHFIDQWSSKIYYDGARQTYALATSWGYAHAYDQTATDTGMYCDWDGDGDWRMPSCAFVGALSCPSHAHDA